MRLRRQVAMVTLVVGAAMQVSAQGSLVGLVWEIRDGEKFPLEGVFVQARIPGERRILAQTRSLRDGSYVLAGLPAKRLSIKAFLKAHYVVSSGGRQTSEILVECSGGAQCSEIDFELSLGAVIEGYAVDPYEFPVQGARISLLVQSENRTSFDDESASWVGRKASNDRGYFRFWGLKPGAYRIKPEPHGRALVADPVDVELDPARREAPIYVSFRNTGPMHSVAGTLRGFQVPENHAATIQFMPVSGGGARYGSGVGSEPFVFNVRGVPTGDYIAIALDTDQSSQPWQTTRRLLGRVRVEHDMEGLELSPLPDTGLVGNVRLDGLKPTRRVSLLLKAMDDTQRTIHERVVAPDYMFDRRDLLPGRYQLRSELTGTYVSQPREFTVRAGRVERLSIELSSEYAAVEGRVRAPMGEEPGLYLVAISNQEGANQSMETDQYGGFVFSKLIPGNYRIAAWSDADADGGGKDAWKRAGEAARAFTLGAGDQVELTLTAVPQEGQ